MLRTLLLPFSFLFATVISAQTIHGRISPPDLAGRWVVLHGTRGSSHYAIDSVRIGRDGQFNFSKRAVGAGFYQLGVNDTDRVDIILTPAEPDVELVFAGSPLQQHIKVLRSAENERLWTYKLLSRELQATQAASQEELQRTRPDDADRINMLNAKVKQAEGVKNAYLDRVLREAPESYFALAVGIDRALDGTERKGPMDVAAVFNFGDPRLLRSAVYDRAIMTFLMNISAVSEDQFTVGSDTLMALAGKDPDCSLYMLEHLMDIFSVYGPQRTVHHLLDRYVVPRGDLAKLPPELRAKVADMLKVAVGATGYDISLNDHGTRKQLSKLMEGSRYTVLFFYSSTCDHCHAQMPVLKDLYAKYPRKDLAIFGIALDADSAEFKQCLTERGIPWPSFSEFNGWGSMAAKLYQVKATPMLYLLDRERRIVMKPVDAVDLEQKFPSLL